jgi:Xaa-Pro aminopeptidase
MPKKAPSPVALLRAELKARKLTGFIVPRQDEFQGEYVAAYAERLHWLTGFAGSWGTAILTQTKGAIFVDGRYTIQVRGQVDTRVFVPHHLADDPPAKWIEANLRKGDRLGFDPWLSTAAEADRYAAACQRAGAKLVAVTSNPVDAVWAGQPQHPTDAIATQPTQFAGRSAADKARDMVKALTALKADAAVLTQPDSVSWVLNLRGFDVPYTPVVLAYAILHRKARTELFIDEAKVPEDVRSAISRIAVIRKPKEIEKVLATLGRKKAAVAIDAGAAPARIRDVLKAKGARLVEARDPCVLPKARKNKVEQEGARAAQRRDGAAMSRFLRWLEAEAPQGRLTEMAVADRLAEFRLATGQLRDLSFDTISAAGPNAAIPHYRVSARSSRTLGANEIFLIDSGGQYQDGTTDITRTTVVGEPSDEMKDRFTWVLKGMIGVSRLRFPAGTCGSQIDAMARQHLWAAGLDYDHGTGHGVGAFLSVHEGPARINKSDRTPLEPGMILSNEPGYYKQGHYGIRIENLLLVEEARDVAGGDRKMLGFETLTLCPIERRLIDPHLFTRDELIWLDAYHARVMKEVGDLLEGDDLAWLKRACAPLR